MKPEERKHAIKALQSQHKNWKSNPRADKSLLHALLKEGKYVLVASQETNMVNMSLVMRKPDFCICENKAADQLRGNREADQRLCFRYFDSTTPLCPKSEISNL